MDLRTRIIITVVGNGVVLMAVGYLMYRVFLQPEFMDAERELAESNLKRCQAALDRESAYLADLVGQWNSLPRYYGEGFADLTDRAALIEEIFRNTDLDFVNTYTVEGRAIRLDARPLTTVPEQLRRGKLPEDSLFLNGVTAGRAAGLTLFGDAMVMVAAARGRTADGGSGDETLMIIGRLITPRYLQKIMRQVDIEFRLVSMDDFRGHPDAGGILSALDQGARYVIRERIRETLNVYTILPAVDGKPSFVLQIPLAKVYTKFLDRRLTVAIISMSVYLLVAFAALATLLQRWFIAPIGRLTRQILNVGDQLVVPGDLATDRLDEIGTLSREFNRLMLKLKGRSDEMELVSRMDNLLAACQDTVEAAQVFSSIATKLFAEHSGSLWLINASHNLLEMITSWGEAPHREVFGTNDCWALRRGQRHLMQPDDATPRCAHLDDLEARSFLCMPLVAQGETLGVLHLMTDEGVRLSGEVERLAGRLARHASLALANIRLREALRFQAARDPLTSLFNRRYLEESLERELSGAKRHGSSVGVMMIDMDHFKRFNDEYGHEAGDYVLKQLGITLRQSIRREDIPCRYGGEEFVLVLPDSSLEDTAARAQDLCERTRRLDLRHADRPLGTATVSIGVSSFPDHGDAGEDLLAAADQALYRAKSGGRDRVVVAETVSS